MSKVAVKKVLVLGATLDEVVAGCGASVAAALSAGDAVRVALVSSGESLSADELLAATRLAPDSLGRLGLPELWPLPGPSRADELIERLVRLIEAWQPDRIVLTVHAANAPFVFSVAAALHRSRSEATVSAVEYADPLPVTGSSADAGAAERRAAAVEALLGQAREEERARIGRAERLRALRAEGAAGGVEFVREISAPDVADDVLWSWIPQGTSPAPAPLVSVIVRTRNRLDLLGEALASLRAQTFRAFEVIVVNDGGADVSRVVGAAADLAIEVVVADPGVGRSAAANLGLQAARGRYVAFLDDDDVFLPHHLETAVSFLEKNGEYAGAYTDVEVTEIDIDRAGGRAVERRRHRPFAQDFDRDLLLFGNYIPIIALVLRSDAARSAGEFRTELDLLEDWDFLIRVSRNGHLHRLPLVTAEYRVRNGGSNQTQIHPWGSLEESLARVDVARRHFDKLTPEALVRCYRVLMERSFRAGHEVTVWRRALEEQQEQRRADGAAHDAALAENSMAWEARVREAREQRSGRDEEAIRRLEAECDLLSTELVRRGEALQAQAGALQRLGAEVERLSTLATSATREAAGLHREVERREELIGAMRATRLWRIRDRLRGRA